MTLRTAIAGLVLLVAVAAGSAAVAFHRWLDRPLAIDAPLAVEIPRGQPLAVTAQALAERGALEHPRWLQAYARYTGADERVHAGEYSVLPGTTPRALLELFESGDVVQHTVTIVEG
ncbi:MAG: aminodeoxychorismate lyase, partial [Lysobacterales bacterium]